MVVESMDKDEAKDLENTSSSLDEELAPCRQYITLSRAWSSKGGAYLGLVHIALLIY